MSEPITKACDGCHGTGWSRGFICGPCDGSGRVPDVEATLRAEVARLTEEVERLKAEKNHARQAQVLIQRARNEESDRSSAAWIAQVKIRDAEVARLTAEVERLTNERDAWRDSSARWGEDCTRLTAEVERLSQREPTQQECDAAEGKPDSEGNTWPDGEVFLGTTCRRCIDCGRWAFGGPTRCLYCAGKYDATVTGQMYLDDLRATKAEVERLMSQLKSAEEVVTQARQLVAYSWEDRLDDSRVSDDAKQDARELEIAVWHYDQRIKTEGAAT